MTFENRTLLYSLWYRSLVIMYKHTHLLEHVKKSHGKFAGLKKCGEVKSSDFHLLECNVILTSVTTRSPSLQ